MDSVPYIVHEGAMARQERTIKRLFIIILVLIVLLVGSNIAWIIYESQFEEYTTSTEVSQDVDSENGDAYVAGIGDVSVGESKTDS